MPQPAQSDGPWGEAIRYWLNVRGWRQADLVDATKMPANTVSRATRGFPTTTNILAKIARGLRAPLDQVLVSPVRKLANEEKRALAAEITEKVLRELDSSSQQAAQSDVDRLEASLTLAVDAEEQRENAPQPKRVVKKKYRRK